MGKRLRPADGGILWHGVLENILFPEIWGSLENNWEMIKEEKKQSTV